MAVSVQGLFLDEKKSRACIHCGLCLSACPTYLETGDENDSPRGRIYLMRAMQEGRLDGRHTAVTHIDRCLGCRACEVACPSGVEYGDLLETTRDFIERTYTRPFTHRLLRRLVIEGVFPHAGRMRLAASLAQLARLIGFETWGPPIAKEALALLPEQRDRVDLPRFSPATRPTARGRVALVTGCVMSVLFNRTNLHTIRLLNRTGFDVVIPSGQVCCGALFAHGGNLERARRFARLNIAAFRRVDCDAVIINAAGCGSTLKEYDRLLGRDAAWARPAKTFRDRVKDLTEFLVDHLDPEATPRANAHDPVTFHDACHLAHPQGIKAAPRELVRRVAGDAYVELPESDVCCGSAGSYNLTEPRLAGQLRARKIHHLLATRARRVITTNPGCILQIQAGLKRAGQDGVQVQHIADYLAAHLKP